jgi:heat shock protein HslJ
MGRVIAPDGINVRSGPGTQYPVIGFAPFGTTGQIAGRSADRQWWAVVGPNSPTGYAWVSTTYVQATNAQNVPVIPPPPLPATATPLPAPTATPLPTPTATVPPAQPTPVPIIEFSASPTTITQGQCTQLRWRVEHVSGVWVYPQGANYVNYPVTGVGSQQECPQSTTTYEMRVLLTNGSVETRQVTINVEAANPLRSTEWALASANGTGQVMPGTSITLNFDDFSGVNGNASCNSYSGTYTVNGSTLLIGGISTSRMACDEDIEQQEQFYLSTLQSSSSYQIQGRQLVIFNPSGQEILRYNPN